MDQYSKYWEILHSLIIRLDIELSKVVKECLDNSAYIEKISWQIIDMIFTPKQLIGQVAMICGLQLSIMISQSLFDICRNSSRLFTKSGRKERDLLTKLKTAKCYSDWEKAAHQLDVFKGVAKWRLDDESTLYDSKMLKKRIKGTLEMLSRGDIFDLMFRLRGGLARDLFGMQHEGLFTKAMAGTKVLVENYHDTTAAALKFISDSPISRDEIPLEVRLAFFNETRHSYGRTALLLSGGAYLGYYHVGVVKALFEEGLLPRVIAGASAGSLTAAYIGTRTDDEFRSMFLDTPEAEILRKEIPLNFFEFSDELKSDVAKQLQYLVPQGLRWITGPIFTSIFDKKILNMSTEHFKKTVQKYVGLYTFQEAFDRTGRIINITVAPLNNYDPPRLLNYLTAPHICVWSAAAASCALPGIFDPVSLIVKEPNGRFRPENEWTRQSGTEGDRNTQKIPTYSDGSLENDLPMQQLSELFNVNHFIVSQANPHSAILSSMAIRANVWSNPLYGAIVGYVRFLKAQCRDWLKNVVNLFVYRSNAPVWSSRRGFTQTLTQEYEGRENDITIMPWIGHISVPRALLSAIKNPTTEEYMELIAAAEANTWPSIPRIRAHGLVEMTLDNCVQKLRRKIAEESNENAKTKRNGILSNGKASNIDRTPSFYTSRSIINLSGLSVSDPVVHIQKHNIPHNNNVTNNNNHNNNQNKNNNNSINNNGFKTSTGSLKFSPLPETVLFKEPNHIDDSDEVSVNNAFHRRRSSSLHKYWNMYDESDHIDGSHSFNHHQENENSYHTTRNQNHFENIQKHLPILSDHTSPPGMNLHSDDSTDDALLLNVRIEDVPIVDHESGGFKKPSQTMKRIGSPDNSNAKEEATIHKTTNMANFYYRHSHSGNELEGLVLD
eukprot:gene15029-20222_t